MSGRSGVHRWVYAIPVLTPEYMRRRQFLRVASGAAGAATAGASGTAVAQETTTGPGGNESAGGTGNESDGGAGNESAGGAPSGGGGTVECLLVDYAYEPGTEEPLYVSPGTTVNFVWDTSTHNINVDSQPDGAGWEGHMPVEDAGFEYSHTFETMGEYEFHCDPHLNLGMEGTIVVNETGQAPGGGGGGEVDPEHMGVPFQAHWVGTATLLGIFASIVFTFFMLKYGETPHSGYPEDK